MSRPDDVPSWGECVKRAWKFWRWMLFIVPAAPIMSWAMVQYILIEPGPKATPQAIADYEAAYDMALYAMPIVAIILWLLLFVMAIPQERTMKTPKEIERRERAMLEMLKRKYDD